MASVSDLINSRAEKRTSFTGSSGVLEYRSVGELDRLSSSLHYSAIPVLHLFTIPPALRATGTACPRRGVRGGHISADHLPWARRPRPGSAVWRNRETPGSGTCR